MAIPIADFYAGGRTRLLSLAAQLGPDAAATPVPALPGWTVKDTYAHLAGTCADYVDGRLDGRGTPSWTARQVTERRDADLPEVCAEWQRRGPELDGLIRQVEADLDDEQAAAERFFHLIPELWAHEYDIRGALVWLGESHDEATSYVIGRLIDHFQGRWREASLPAIRIVGDEGDWWVLGQGEPVATLTGTGDYDIARMLIGRRSRDQILTMGWDGDPRPFVDHLHLFDLPEHDVLD
jgi:uncharacterized protein (TIGR03083 family)